jgi:hypothetical protein
MKKPVLLLVIILLVMFAGGAGAQEITATVSGTVVDATGAVVPNVPVRITNTDTGLVWNVASNASGRYAAPALPVGRYHIQVGVAGFRKVEIDGISLQVDQRARIDITLQPGDVAESVTVVGEALGQLEAESSSMGALINSSQVRDLPLPSRNVLNMLTLVGGVSSGGAATGINASQLSINGSRTLNSEFSVDGVSVVSGSTGGVQRVPSTEAVREFRVLTSGYTAEYGRTSGGYVNLVIDSGTNQFHGSVYEYFRNEKLNANNFFRNLRNQPRQSDRYNQFGGKFSGPVWIPGLYNGRDKTFFFFNYEGLRRREPFNNLSTVPSAEYRRGDFSASPIPVFDPDGNTQFPNNTIPANLIDPAALKIMGLLPQPNSPGTRDAANNRAVNNFVSAGSTAPRDNQITIRGDHAIREASRLFGRLTYIRNLSPSSVRIPGPLDPRVGDSVTTTYQAAASWTEIWSSRIVTEAWLGFQRNNPKIDPPSLGLDVPGVLGIQRQVYPAVPRFNFGWTDLGIDANTYRRQIDNNYQGAASLTWNAGTHTVKTGFQLRKNQFNVFNPGGAFTGIYFFNGEMTSPARTAGNPVHSLADLLLGQIQRSNYDLPQPITGRRNSNLGLFVQDDWKATRRLTINLGLRYEYESPMTVSNDIYSRIDSVTGKLLVAGKNASRSLNLEPDRANLAPRVGFAYSLNDRTVIRSAFGIFYSQIFSNLGGIVLYPGFTVQQQFPDLGAGVAQPFRLSQGMPLVAVQNLDDPFFVERAATVSSPLAAGTLGAVAQWAKIDPMPSSLQWNFGVQREIVRGTIADVSYVGTRGLHLPHIQSFNQFPIERGEDLARSGSALDIQRARQFPTVDPIWAYVHAATSSYHSLQVKGNRQFSRGIGFLASYTWSKSIDDASGIFNFSQPNGLDHGQFPSNFRYLDRAVSAFDRPHSFAAALQYATGGPRWLRGWTLSPVLLVRDGLPDTIWQTALHPLAIQQRPHVINSNGGGFASGIAPAGTAVRYLVAPADPSFPFTPSGPFFSGTGSNRTLVLPFRPGTLGRNTTRDPGEVNLDLAVARNFPIRERLRLELRAEAFNVLNHTNFNAPVTTLNVALDSRTGQAAFNSPDFGLITAAKASRFLQLVLRLEF